MRFVDLFAGLGGFHVALAALGGRCVFACELDESLRDLYEHNFGLRPAGDIREIDADKVPAHDVLCAGFPCQPFSKAGEQQGRGCGRNGNLVDYVVSIVATRQPSYFILENVANLTKHDKGRTWEGLEHALRTAGPGYDLRYTRLSPHQYGVPHTRDRLFIVGRVGEGSLADFTWPTPCDGQLHIGSVLDDHPEAALRLSEDVLSCLATWQQFLQRYPSDEALPSFPIWSMEFGATYPYEESWPHQVGSEQLGNYAGAFGHDLSQVMPTDRSAHLPGYARTTSRFPRWKQTFIRQNRELGARHRTWLDEWLPDVQKYPASRQKFEWNCQGEERDLWRHVIQLRASGVRVKRATSAPALVAMTATQVPIIGWQRRYMTIRECQRLQSLESLAAMPRATTSAFRALGNAVNAEVVRRVAEQLLCQAGSSRESTRRERVAQAAS